MERPFLHAKLPSKIHLKLGRIMNMYNSANIFNEQIIILFFFPSQETEASRIIASSRYHHTCITITILNLP